ncbi:transcription factor kayak isoform X3 [Neocloeon triangulifer]|uniref:transcription factor kayak isoform X3 n=1 Tax=Neocloeon triangulifer TaxID=2078957 RepID=UPI00286F0F7F|nr:transcription factor kayak isoform X3 [Neocloeon triangulifer]
MGVQDAARASNTKHNAPVLLEEHIRIANGLRECTAPRARSIYLLNADLSFCLSPLNSERARCGSASSATRRLVVRTHLVTYSGRITHTHTHTRAYQYRETGSLSDVPHFASEFFGFQLTAEDAERRRRRRERNKIAATKCRLKKREKTVNLVQESEVLDAQNHDLKAQIKNLEAEQRRLVDMLTVHQPACINNITSNPVSLIGVKDPQMAPHNQHHYSNYYSGHGSCNSPQESPQNPYVHVEVYPHHQGLDRGCLV